MFTGLSCGHRGPAWTDCRRQLSNRSSTPWSTLALTPWCPPFLCRRPMTGGATALGSAACGPTRSSTQSLFLQRQSLLPCRTMSWWMAWLSICHVSSSLPRISLFRYLTKGCVNTSDRGLLCVFFPACDPLHAYLGDTHNFHVSTPAYCKFACSRRMQKCMCAICASASRLHQILIAL